MVAPMMSGRGIRGWFVGICVVSSVTALLGGCGGTDAGPSGDYCATWAGKQRECGIRTEGETACVNYYDAAEPCETRCLANATCAALVTYTCGSEASLADSLSGCMAECVGLQPVTCKSGLKLSGYTHCNGAMDCGTDDATDEADCNGGLVYRCRNVDESIDSAKRCDGKKDCSDGSDETSDCKPIRRCQSGGGMIELTSFDICDGFPRCDDGSDEPSNCSTLTCPE